MAVKRVCVVSNEMLECRCVDVVECLSDWLQYLDVAQHLTGYAEIMFPHCTCDARKDGHVIAIAGAVSFKLQACKEDGSPEVHRRRLSSFMP